MYALLLASVLAGAPMNEVEAGTSGCAAARASTTDDATPIEGGRCKKLTSAKIDAGSADVYRVTDGDTVRFALAVTDADGHRYLSSLDLDAARRQLHLRVIEVEHRPAFALDILSKHDHQFLVCSAVAGDWSCASAEGRSLSDDGVIHQRRHHTVKLALR